MTCYDLTTLKLDTLNEGHFLLQFFFKLKCSVLTRNPKYLVLFTVYNIFLCKIVLRLRLLTLKNLVSQATPSYFTSESASFQIHC